MTISRETILQTLKWSQDQYPQMLEKKFPHVLEKITKLWNSPDGAAYLTDLLQGNGRGGGRVGRDGFPEKVWQGIFQLAELYRKPYARQEK